MSQQAAAMFDELMGSGALLAALKAGEGSMADILDYCKGRQAHTFRAGHVLIEEGGHEGKLFVLAEGQVEVLRKDTQVSYIDEPGSIFGEMAALLDMPSSATVKALSTVKVYVIDDALSFLGGNPEIALYVATLLARRLYYTTSYLVDLQQQAEGRREDLDLVDKILAQLVEPDETKRSGKKK
jgi:CRP/FNR family cyclic AMP-dependent transcriptional regulator